jgi:hypothetical protein
MQADSGNAKENVPMQNLVTSAERNRYENNLQVELAECADQIVTDIQLCNRSTYEQLERFSEVGSLIALARTGLSRAFINEEPAANDPEGDDPSYDYYYKTKWDVERVALTRALMDVQR